MKKNIVLALAILAQAVPPPLWSAAVDPGLEFLQSEAGYFLNIPVQVASTKAESILKTVSTVSIIDRKMIQDYNFQTVSDAVATVAGFDVIRTPFMNTVPMSRGILQFHYANKTLVLINNIPSWFTTTGEGFLNRVDIHDVERIEVLKGPASVLYGSNAYSGVVNIILKQRKEAGSSMELHGKIGTEKTYGAGGNYSNKRDDFLFSVSANGSGEEGHEVIYADETGETGRVRDVRYPKGGNFTVTSKYKQHSVLFNGYKDEFTDLEGDIPTYAGGAGKPHHRDGYLGNYTFNENFAERVDVQYTATYDWNFRRFSRLRDDSFRTDTSGYRVNTGLKTDTRVTDWFNVEIGGDYEYRWVDYYKNYFPHTGTISTYSNIRDRHVYEYSGFSQLGFSAEKVKLQVGSRLTRNELFGENLSSRGSIVYMINEHNSLKLIAGQSFRAPAIFESYFLSASRSVLGSTKLDPETSNSVEIAYLTSFKDAFIQILGYEARYKNKIERRTEDVLFPDGELKRNVRVYRNGNEFKARGVELEVNYRNPKVVNAFSNLSYITTDDGEAANFRFVPDVTVVGGLARDIRNFFVSTVVSHRSKTGGRLDAIRGFTTADASVGFKMDNDRVRHTLTVANVTDEQVYFPEYVRQTGNFLNQVPSENRRRILYTVSVKF